MKVGLKSVQWYYSSTCRELESVPCQRQQHTQDQTDPYKKRIISLRNKLQAIRMNKDTLHSDKYQAISIL